MSAKDQRHLARLAEMLYALLLSGSALLADWLSYRQIGRNPNDSRAALQRWSYWLNNERIEVNSFYKPLLAKAVQEFAGQTAYLSIDTSLLWNRFCLCMVALRWGGRSIPVCWAVYEHPSASVAFAVYQPLLGRARSLLPSDCHPFLLADRGFDHLELVRYLQQQQWGYAIRVKGNRCFWQRGRRTSVRRMDPGTGKANLCAHLALDAAASLHCNLVVGTACGSRDRWVVITSEPPTLAVFELYSWRFQIEALFCDCKAAQLDLRHSGLRNAAALERLVLVISIGILWASQQGQSVCRQQLRRRLDAHTTRGWSYLKLGLTWLKAVIQWDCPILDNLPLSPHRQLPAQASHAQRRKRADASLFDHVFSLAPG
jgi:hypothetical protein